MSKKELQDALELLAVATFITPKLQAKRTEVINAGLQALAEQPAQQGPVVITEQMAFAFHNAITDGALGTDDIMDIMRGLEAAFAHITTPQPAQRKPLTVAEVEQILTQHNYEIHGDRARYIVRMTEFAHGIKENT